MHRSAGEIFKPPVSHTQHHILEGLPTRRQLVGHPAFIRGRGFAGDEAFLRQPCKTSAEDIGRNPFGRGEKFIKILFPTEKITNHQQRPTVAQQIEGTGYGAT